MRDHLAAPRGRCYVLRTCYPDLRPYIVGEITRDQDEEATMESARSVAWMRGDIICTADQLALTLHGRRALADWQAGDDSQNEEALLREQEELRAEEGAIMASRPSLRILPGGSAP
jgi:hypothetical protein